MCMPMHFVIAYQTNIDWLKTTDKAIERVVRTFDIDNRRKRVFDYPMNCLTLSEAAVLYGVRW